ncbi:sn-glycerol-3-phosphate ABC transporter permease UgpE [Pararhizobium mangrovi]|uniref:sn-glycerol-3-phosphate transport system permease protein UgpE n=1 Tax=Pararhizobium mangrovi TaxID=2590452 RepID=A0A506UB63_9HYPH|nr:sn-glycerol-3-phosphate ABC transporter permease UgpE [Pararhizobium mangrovi]TPW29037.1 sn-glycerol-3-phosphate ABC transporter permease UgpE [Pararhizobium mangrovi]
MIENRPVFTFFAHAVLLVGLAIVIFPIYLAFVASTQDSSTFLGGVVPLLPSSHMLETYGRILGSGFGSIPVWRMIANSMVMALGIAIGKIAISIISAFAIVYFRFPFRTLAFWLIFITLMLPVEVRILPTYSVAAGLDLLNTYQGLILPVIASATATFLFRQFFMTIPDELLEAALLDRASPMQFFKDIMLPLSRTNIAALFVILFIYGWNQYLWPLIITTDQNMTTIVVGIKQMVNVADGDPQWQLVMGTAILAMVPPVLVVLFFQRWFIKGLTEPEK